jgi:uncharacterized protein
MARRLPSSIYALYKRTLSPMLHSITGNSGACRFQPTCSEYAVLSVERHGWLYGSWLALIRVLRCNPFSRGGFDPVPGTWPLQSPPPVKEIAPPCRVGPSQLP